MAEGLLRHDAGEYFEVESAGTWPDTVRPEAIVVMREVGIDIRRHRSRHTDELGGLQFDFIITVHDNARESCPIFLGHGQKLHGDFEDPAAFAGSEEQRLDLFRRVRDDLRSYLREFALIVTSAEPGIDE
jgi:arsenate reductase